MYKLDLTEIYIRKEIDKATKDNRVNQKQKVLIDNRMKRLEYKEKLNNRNTKGRKRRYLTITGTKATNNFEVEATMDEKTGRTSTGIFIDKIK
ncbi:hypothetical protein NNC19_00425 [Clostridium sp. SHJSY1]|uniref:hypothetical protein n=1 Tax=Clostridium sp. SHJSY1 TaxID=2942483 RepID=UPI0028742D95|nr:hypothetical protein [Clostridium sp. SHJSY1]MDS0524119.1 hypothetical protein [Clostridium sp. SHJSY1]